MTREEATIQALQGHIDALNETIENQDKVIKALEQKPKTGHWKAKSFHELFCDNCGFDFDIMRNDFTDKMLYCPNCGAKMVEPQESEEINV